MTFVTKLSETVGYYNEAHASCITEYGYDNVSLAAVRREPSMHIQ